MVMFNLYTQNHGNAYPAHSVKIDKYGRFK